MDQVWSQLLLADSYLRYITHTDYVTESLSEEYREILAPLEVAEKGDYIYRLYAVSLYYGSQGDYIITREPAITVTYGQFLRCPLYTASTVVFTLYL